jgi:lysophospholipase L1-like esterase
LRQARPLVAFVFILLGVWLVSGATACRRAPAAPELPSPTIGPDPVPPPPPPRLSRVRVLAFGDSQTEGLATPVTAARTSAFTPGVPRSYPFKLQELLKARYTTQTIEVFNAGRGGERAAEAFDRLLAVLAETRPDVTILFEGVNDLSTGATVEDTIDELRVLIREIQRTGSDVLVSTLPPQRPGAPRAFSAHLVLPFNAALTVMAPAAGAHLADIYPVITVPIVDGLLAPDGLHLTELGNARIAETYLSRLKELFEGAGGIQELVPSTQVLLPPGNVLEQSHQRPLR